MTLTVIVVILSISSLPALAKTMKKGELPDYLTNSGIVCQPNISTDPAQAQFFFFPDPRPPQPVDESSKQTMHKYYKNTKPVGMLLFIGGFLSSIFGEGNSIMKLITPFKYTQRVILHLDWSSNNGYYMCKNPDYCTAAINTECIGRQRRLGLFLNNALVHFGMTFDDLEIIAFSLGCHLSGTLADNIYREFGQRVGRINAIDPAGPGYFGSFHISRKLRREDASLVVTYNTDCGALGLGEEIGHINIAANNCGSPFGQPGCRLTDANFSNFGQLAQNISKGCSHVFGNDFYVDLIRNATQSTYYGAETVFYEVAGLSDTDRTRPRYLNIWPGDFSNFRGTNKSIAYGVDYLPNRRNQRTGAWYKLLNIPYVARIVTARICEWTNFANNAEICPV